MKIIIADSLPDSAAALHNLGKTLQELGRLDEAEASYRQAIVLQPNYAEAYNNLGVALEKLNKYEEAIEKFEKAILSKKNFSEVLEKAKKLGFAESNPISDLNGNDSAAKLRIVKKKFSL